jgi:hypothetical protein
MVIGTYNDAVSQDNYVRRLVGIREKPEVVVHRVDQETDEETLAHEYGHKFYYNEPEVAWNWVLNAPEEKKAEAWNEYGTPAVREQKQSEPKVAMVWRHPVQAESFAMTAEKTYKDWKPSERQEHLPNLFDEKKISKQLEQDYEQQRWRGGGEY